MATKLQLIELERRFREWSRDTPPEPEVRSLWFARPTISWPDLLSKPCAVVLGEAGAGKTSEFRRVAASLRSEGKQAFFIPVETVAASGVEKALDIGTARLLRAWRHESSDEAWFFLDSVDESKLKGRPLATALNALSHELEAHLGRIRLVLSSRASDWRSSDEEVVATLRPLLAGECATDEGCLFCLAPLSGSQVAKLATHHGLSTEEVSTFLDQVREADAWVFLERPLDVASLVDYWREHRRLGSHREVVSNDIDGKLAERAERQSSVSLSVARARSGARKLALVAILTQSSTFQVPDEPLDPNAGKPIVPAEVLRAWNPDEILALLTRGLFDEATYGRVRIHHRQALEFLAAEELMELRAAGVPRDDLHALLFRVSNASRVVPSHLRAVVAWCSLWDHDIREQATTAIQEHLLDQGDPSGLPANTRRAALLAYVEQFGDRENVYHGFDTFGLKRFACSELVQTIRETFEAPSTAEHVRTLLLQMVEYGGLLELGSWARAVALAPATPSRVRIAAIEATAKVGSRDDRAALLGLVQGMVEMDRNVAATLIAALYPDDMTDDDFHALVRATPRPPRRGYDRLEQVLSTELLDRCSPQQRIAFIGVLADDMSGISAADGKRYVKKERFWLIETLAHLMSTEVASPHIPSTTRNDALWVLETCLDDPHYFSEHDLEPLTKGDDLREAYFWNRADARLREDRKYPRQHWLLRLPHRMGLRKEDAVWLRRACLERRSVRERLLAFHALIHVSVPQDAKPESWDPMHAVACESDERHGGSALQTRLSRFRAWMPGPPEPWEVHNRLQQKAHERRRDLMHKQAHGDLRANLEGIRRGERGLIHLFEACPKDGSSKRSYRVSIEAVATLYDSDIAAAARQGFLTFWKNAPLIPVESHPERSIPWACIIGLVGLALEEENGTDLSQLDDALFRRAVTYAPWEMNGFPPWLEKCAALRPQVVRDVFAPALQQDFNRSTESPDELGHVLWKLAYEPLPTRAACAELLARALVEREPPRLSTLRDVLKTLEDTHALSDDSLLRLARDRVAAVDSDFPRFAMWWAELAVHRPREAGEILARTAARAMEPAALVEAAFARLADRYDAKKAEGLDALRGDAAALGVLYELGLKYVKPEDDLVHEGGYSPTARDGAQGMRSNLIGWLGAVLSEEGTAELSRLLDSSVLKGSERDWVVNLVRSHTILHVSKAMTVPDAVNLLNNHVIEPSTVKELFAIAHNRLRDIQFGLANADFSVRQVYNPAKKAITEEPVQNLLAKELHEARRGQYVVVREPEVARRKKPDIRLVNARFAEPVTIEAKIAERWDRDELERALSLQLVGQYMRDNSSQYGILLLCSSGPPHSWYLPDGSALSFPQLIAHLERQAAAIVNSTPNVKALSIVSLDFH
jgi:hypothetical protein